MKRTIAAVLVAIMTILCIGGGYSESDALNDGIEAEEIILDQLPEPEQESEEDMATGDKLVNLDDLKVAYDKQQEDTNALKNALKENILPTNNNQWDVFIPVYSEGGVLKYNYYNDNFVFKTTDGYYGFMTELLECTSGIEISYIVEPPYKVIFYYLSSARTFIATSGFKIGYTMGKVTTPTDTAYILVGISRSDSERMNIDDLTIAMKHVYVYSDELINYTKTEHALFKEAKCTKCFQGNIDNTQRYETVNYTNDRRRVVCEFEVLGGREYSFSVNDGYQIYARDLDENKNIISISGWITSGIHRTPTMAKYIAIIVRATNDDPKLPFVDIQSAGLKLRITGGENEQFIEEQENGLNNIIKGEFNNLSNQDFERGTFTVGNTNYFTYSNSDSNLRLQNNIAFMSGEVYKIEFDGHGAFQYLVWGTNQTITDGTGNLYSGWLHSDSWYALDNSLDINIRIMKNDGTNISDSELNGFTISIKKVSFDDMQYNFFEDYWIAHRCGMNDAPENTVPALKKAYENGFKICEIDVRFSSDNIPFVIHDDTVTRTTDGEGVVAELTAAQLKEFTIDAGPHVIDYPNTKIPTFEEMVSAAKRYNMKLAVDNLNVYDVEKVQIVIEIIKKYRMTQNVVLRTTLAVGRIIKPYIDGNYFISGNINEMKNSMNSYLGLYPSALCGWSSYSTPSEWKEFADECHMKGLLLGMYIHDGDMVDDYIDKGIDFMIVDGVDSIRP